MSQAGNQSRPTVPPPQASLSGEVILRAAVKHVLRMNRTFLDEEAIVVGACACVRLEPMVLGPVIRHFKFPLPWHRGCLEQAAEIKVLDIWDWRAAGIPLNYSVASALECDVLGYPMPTVYDVLTKVVVPQLVPYGAMPDVRVSPSPIEHAGPGPFLLKILEEMDDLRKHLDGHVSGQEAAKTALVQGYGVSRMQGRSSQGPLGLFTFLGPPGTGKTLMVKAFLRFLESRGPVTFSGKSMSQLHSVHSELTLKDGPRDGVGVLLFDEVEKAHANVHASLLNFLGGQFTSEAEGGWQLRNTWVFFTSNLGQDMIPAHAGRVDSDSLLDLFLVLERAKALGDVNDPRAVPVFAPEFISRLRQGHAVLFRSLEPHHLMDLTRKHLPLF